MPAARHQVPSGLYWQTRLFAATRRLWLALGNLESSVLRDELESKAIEAPIYVCGLARSGTTMLTELLNAHPDVTSHRYSDFPATWTPYWRNWLRQRSQVVQPKPVERAHQDRIQVTQDSPEAVEEVLWMYFHPECHDAGHNQHLGADHQHPEFEAFYRDHLAKLLLVRQARRYLAKGNYNVSRLGYLQRLFPDARFVLAWRDPVAHIASLQKQHRLFSEGQTANPRMRFQLGASGHFEFGLDRTPINWGDSQATREILDCWQEGQEVRGWALYWAGLYQYLVDQVESSTSLSDAAHWVAYEQLCSESESTIDRLLDQCALPAEPFSEQRARYSAELTLPDYYQPHFSAEEEQLIRQLTGPAVERLRTMSLCR
ncbi:MAG: sulfotransferase [Xanthomonadales bacterium]|nr:sulfotransferase [Xanthomonadales bacterium]